MVPLASVQSDRGTFDHALGQRRLAKEGSLEELRVLAIRVRESAQTPIDRRHVGEEIGIVRVFD